MHMTGACGAEERRLARGERGRWRKLSVTACSNAIRVQMYSPLLLSLVEEVWLANISWRLITNIVLITRHNNAHNTNSYASTLK